VPRIPIYTKRQVPKVVPGVRVSPSAMTQDIAAMGQLGGAMAQTGSAITKVGMEYQEKLREARELSEYSSAENQWKDGINQFKEGLDTDYKTYDKRFNEYTSSLYKEINTNITEPKAQDAFKRFIDSELVKEGHNIRTLAGKKEIEFMKGNFYKQIELAVKRGDTDFINKFTSGAIKAGYMDADVGETARQNALKKVEYDSIWKTAISMPDEEAATAFIEDAKGLTPSERSSLLTGVSRHYTAEEARQKDALEKQREAQRVQILPRLRSGELSAVEIYNSSFDEKEKKQWLDWMDKRNKAIAAGKKDPLTVTNDAVYGNMSERISLYPETVKREDIWALHGKGLSTDDCEKLTKQHETNLKDPIKFQGGKRAHASLLKLKNAGVFGEGVEAETVWGQKANALDNYLSDNSDASNEEITKFFEGLVAEEKSNWFGGMLDAYWNQLTFGLGKAIKPTGRAVEQKLDAKTAAAILKETGGDKEKAREIAKERGYKF